ncbi:MAG: amidase [Planctomycetes bacterium]|nr:amidase [Planctomycetota bacterium]
METLPSISEAINSIRNGQLRPTELVDHCLLRIRQFEDRVHAWVRVDGEGARLEAERLDDLARQGRFLGPLHGIPIGIKDIVDVQGMPTEAGSPLLKGNLAERDAPAVARLRECGAIILGKTVTTEFACFDPPSTRNPWNLNHTPGGSSSGSAAAVSLEMCMAAIGSQTGGSITRPASFCGVTGLKPSFGRVDLTGVVPISRRLDHLGPIARSAGDLAVMLAALAPSEKPTAPSPPVSASPTLHIIEDCFFEQADDDVRQATRFACDKLHSAGAELRRMPLPASFGQVHAMHRCVMVVDAAATHFDRFAQHADAYGPNIRSLIEEGLSTLAIDYTLALQHYEQHRREMEAAFRDDVIALTPATVTPAPAGLDSTGDPAFNSPWSYSGLPTVVIPCGLAANGMPCGLQLIGPRDGELQLLSAAAWCEVALEFEATPSILQAER